MGLTEIENALGDKDPKSVGNIAHRIKGGALNIMCNGMENVCRSIESLGLQYENHGMDKDDALKKQAAELDEVKHQAALFKTMLKRRHSPRK